MACIPHAVKFNGEKTLKSFRIAAVLLLCLAGSARAECMLGEITSFAGNFVPRGYAAADGKLLLIADHQSLFAILGVTYGGDGTTTFALPNLQNRFVHQPKGDASGTGIVEIKTLICISGIFPTRS